MKKILVILTCLDIVFSFNIQCQTSLYNNVVAYWKLDESSGATTAADALGNYSGTITGAICGATGKINTCYTFASGNYITFGTSSALDLGTTDFTVSAWIKTTSTNSQVIVSKHSSANGYGYYIGMNNGYPYVELVGSSGTTVTALGECQYNDGYWHLMTVIFDRDGSLTIYIDTEIEAQENISSIAGGIYSTQNLFIAHSPYYTSRSFIGSIDEVYIWNRVLTDQEVANYLYNGGTGRSYPFGYIAVTGISVTPETKLVKINATAQLTAAVSPQNATDLTVTWTSDDEEAAIVSPSGVVTGIDEGLAVITATASNSSFTDVCLVTVIVPVTGVSVSPTTATVTKGSITQLTATVAPTYAYYKTVSWSSSNTSVATVSSSGAVTGIAKGTAIITATTTDGSYTATCTVTVRVPVTGVSVSPTTVTVNKNLTTTLTAIISPTDASNTTVTWNSSNTSVAMVNASSGVVTGVAPGTATITATTGEGSYTATCAVTVIIPVTGISVSPTLVSVAKGSDTTLTATVLPTNATNKTVTWISGNTSVATVSSIGVVTGVNAGTATITATTANGSYTATSAVTVTIPVTGVTISPTTVSIEKSATTQLVATVLPLDATNKAVTWTSGNTSIATVSSSGVVTGVGAGTATITVTTSDGNKTGSCSVTVTVAVTGVSLPSKASVLVNKVVQLRSTFIPSDATNQNVTWTSANSTIATVNATGLVSGIAPGTANIIVTTSDGSKKDTCVVTVLSSSANWLNNGDDIYYSSGNVGIGIDSAVKTLTVNGKILAERITVVSSITSDYVFEPGYKLMPIHELEAYIKQHKHLPGVPSAAEFARQGQNLGKMDDLLLRKIEELTLYILEQEKEIADFQKATEELTLEKQD